MSENNPNSDVSAGITDLPDGVVVGASTAFTFGIVSETTVGLSNENFIGGKIEINASMGVELTCGIKCTVNYSTEYVYHEAETIERYAGHNTKNFDENVNNVYKEDLTDTITKVYSGNYLGGFSADYAEQAVYTYNQGKIVNVTGNSQETISGQLTFKAGSVSSTVNGAIDQQTAGYSITMSGNKSFNVTSGTAVLQVSPQSSFLQIGSQGITMTSSKTTVAGTVDIGVPASSSSSANIVTAQAAQVTVNQTSAQQAISSAKSKMNPLHSKFVQSIFGRKL